MRRASPYTRMLQLFEYLVLARARWQLSLVWLVLFMQALPQSSALRRVLLIQFLLPRQRDHEALLGTDHGSTSFAAASNALNLVGSKRFISKIGICQISKAESFKQYRGFGI